MNHDLYVTATYLFFLLHVQGITCMDVLPSFRTMTQVALNEEV